MLVNNHAIETRRQLHITRNDNTRFRVICMGGIPKLSSCEINVGGPSQPTAFKGKSGNTQNATGPSQDGPNPKKNTPPTCPWMLYVSKVKKAGSWVVKTLNKEHEDLQRKYQVEVTLHQVFRAKMKATEKVQGHYRAQYENLRNYCEELLRSNPGSTVKIDVEPCGNPSSPTKQFRRIYVCLGALKAGFKLIGRPILGLDGCFLKGPFPGQILTAVGVDGNNGIYPVAYAVVEAETTASWTWFLGCLGDDLELEHNSNFSFITDRQKGLIPAILKVYPSSEHRYCLRHIHENMKSKWGGDEYKNLLWNCASASTVPEFEKAIKAVLDKDKGLHDWLKEIPTKHWVRAYFTGRAREYLMKKIVVVNNKIGKCKGPLTPAATAVLQTAKTEAAEYTVIWTGGTKFQVSTHFNDHQDQRVVVLDERTCSCRRWDLTGIPC
ncbi:uncharacterized protein LOC110920000 [Helianthus annuus]|uniref:uncharacterized protein LOC110920000 n=1 Tax=Helianthus annuus TaxID=4232 RepID=UPI000B904AD5|nr:uncharacterized protein LOC110920000 [Helianthus annuus]